MIVSSASVVVTSLPVPVIETVDVDVVVLTPRYFEQNLTAVVLRGPLRRERHGSARVQYDGLARAEVAQAIKRRKRHAYIAAVSVDNAMSTNDRITRFQRS